MTDDLAPSGKKTLTPLNMLTGIVLIAGAIYLMTSQQHAPPRPPAITPPKPVQSAELLFTLGERDYSLSALPLEIQEPIYQIRKVAHQQQMLVLEQAVVDAYIHQQAEEQGLDQVHILEKLFPQAQPNEDEMRAFYQQNQSSNTPPFEKIKPQIQEYLTQSKREVLKKELLTQLLVKGEARLLLEAPASPSAPTLSVKGDPQ